MGQRITYKIRKVMYEEAFVELTLTEEQLNDLSMDEVEFMVKQDAESKHLFDVLPGPEYRVDEWNRMRWIDGVELPIAAGFSEWKKMDGTRDGDPGGRIWAILGAWATKLDDDDIMYGLAQILEDGKWGFQCEHSGGPGQSFAKRPYVAKRTNTRVLVTQNVGLDI